MVASSRFSPARGPLEKGGRDRPTATIPFTRPPIEEKPGEGQVPPQPLPGHPKAGSGSSSPAHHPSLEEQPSYKDVNGPFRLCPKWAVWHRGRLDGSPRRVPGHRGAWCGGKATLHPHPKTNPLWPLILLPITEPLQGGKHFAMCPAHQAQRRPGGLKRADLLNHCLSVAQGCEIQGCWCLAPQSPLWSS